MYVAYYILKHKLIGEAMNEYLAKVIKEWKSLETQGWCGYSKMYSGEKYFRERVDSLIDTYSDEEQILNLYGVGSSPTWGTCGGGAMVAYWAHNPETTFESSDRNYSHLYICIFRMLRRQTAISCMLT